MIQAQLLHPWTKVNSKDSKLVYVTHLKNETEWQAEIYLNSKIMRGLRHVLTHT